MKQIRGKYSGKLMLSSMCYVVSKMKENITHVDNTIDPVRDKRKQFDIELQLKDLETVEKPHSQSGEAGQNRRRPRS